MTSNVGTKMLKDFGTGVGFTTKNKQGTNVDEIKSILEKELKKKFAPEFINRLDEIIYFKDLDKEDITKIVTLELAKSITRAKLINFNIVVEPSLVDHLTVVGYDPQYGARPLKRSIQKFVDDVVTDYIITSNPKKESTLTLSYNTESEDVDVNETFEPSDVTEVTEVIPVVKKRATRKKDDK